MLALEFLDVPQAAERLKVNADLVRSWIGSGELPAANIAKPGGRKPRWRIAEADLAAFLERRGNRKPESPAPRRRAAQKRDPNWVQYF